MLQDRRCVRVKKKDTDLHPFVYLGPDCPTLYYPRNVQFEPAATLPSFLVHKSSLQPHGFLLPTRVNNQSAGPQTDPIATESGRRFQYHVQTDVATSRSLPSNVQIAAGNFIQNNIQMVAVMNNNQGGDHTSGFGHSQRIESKEVNGVTNDIQIRSNALNEAGSNRPSYPISRKDPSSKSRTKGFLEDDTADNAPSLVNNNDITDEVEKNFLESEDLDIEDEKDPLMAVLEDCQNLEEEERPKKKSKIFKAFKEQELD